MNKKRLKNCLNLLHKMNLQEEYKKKKSLIESRLNEFKNIPKEEYFYELCFCILTPQSTARGADRAIQLLKQHDFKNLNFNPSQYLQSNIRFHNNKSFYLLEFKAKHEEILQQLSAIKDNKEKREFLVNNLKGLGLKEASHFLRNTGHENLAILDRHILKNLLKQGAIKELPKSLTRSKYLEIEQQFIDFANKQKIPLDHLDLLFWSNESGEIFK